MKDCTAALNKLLLIVDTVLASDLISEILCSVTQLHENVNGELHTTGLVAPGEQVAGLVVPEQYGDHVLKLPEQQYPLLQVAGL